MAIQELGKQLAALEAMRAEIEGALGSDENWRALRRASRDGVNDTDRLNRDTRLTKALEANPLYLAWKNLCDTIAALRDADHAAKAAGTRDDLSYIRGISPSLARRLAENGITRYAKIAAWTVQDINIATEVLDLPVGEIERQNWIGQAKLLTARKSEVVAPSVAPLADVEPDVPEPILLVEPQETEEPEGSESELERSEPDEVPAEVDPVDADVAAAAIEDADIAEEAVAMEAIAEDQEHSEPDAPEADDTSTAAAAGNTDIADDADIELPEDIRQKIRADAADIIRFESPNGANPAAIDNAASEDIAVSNGKLAGKLAAIPSIEPIGGTVDTEIADRLDKLETDIKAFNEAIEDPVVQQATEPLPTPAGTPGNTADAADAEDVDVVTTVRMNAEPSEAKVTFIRRDPPPADPSEPMAASDAAPATPKETYLTPAAPGEEAEVTIVKPEAPDVGRVRRFLKALSGD